MSKLIDVVIEPMDCYREYLCLFCHEPATYWLERKFLDGGFCDPICNHCRDAWNEIKQDLSVGILGKNFFI